MKPRAARAFHATALAAAATAMAVGVAACSLSQEGVMPPSDTFFFPTSAIMAPDGHFPGWLFVANSNADLRYNDGTLVVVNVGEDVKGAVASGIETRVGAASDRARASQWAVCGQQDYVKPLSRNLPPICCWDALDPNILNCDERRYVQPDATVRIGSFTAGMAWQQNCQGSCDQQNLGACTFDPEGGRIIMGVRGDTSLTFVDVTPPAGEPRPGLHCREDGADGPLAECTQKVTSTTSNLLSEANDKAISPVQLPDEPYALAYDKGRDLLYVGHLVGNTSTVDSGGISVFNMSMFGQMATATGFPPKPTFIAPFPSPFSPNSAGSFGITNLTLHPPLGNNPYDPNANSEILASSRYLPQVTSMVPYLSGGQAATDFNCKGSSDVVLLGSGDSLSPGLIGTEIRGVAIVDPPRSPTDPTQPAAGEPQRVFALERVPPDLAGFDVSRAESGGLTARPTSLIETCSSPTFLYKNAVNGQRDRLYVNCFDTGEIYVFDPTIPSLITTIQAARGPSGIVFDSDPSRPVAYVLDFTLNNIAVVDLTPGSPTEDHVIQRIGFPTTTPR